MSETLREAIRLAKETTWAPETTILKGEDTADRHVWQEGNYIELRGAHCFSFWDGKKCIGLDPSVAKSGDLKKITMRATVVSLNGPARFLAQAGEMYFPWKLQHFEPMKITGIQRIFIGSHKLFRGGKRTICVVTEKYQYFLIQPDIFYENDHWNDNIAAWESSQQRTLNLKITEISHREPRPDWWLDLLSWIAWKEAARKACKEENAPDPFPDEPRPDDVLEDGSDQSGSDTPEDQALKSSNKGKTRSTNKPRDQTNTASRAEPKVTAEGTSSADGNNKRRRGGQRGKGKNRDEGDDDDEGGDEGGGGDEDGSGDPHGKKKAGGSNRRSGHSRQGAGGQDSPAGILGKRSLDSGSTDAGRRVRMQLPSSGIVRRPRETPTPAPNLPSSSCPPVIGADNLSNSAQETAPPRTKGRKPRSKQRVSSNPNDSDITPLSTGPPTQPPQLEIVGPVLEGPAETGHAVALASQQSLESETAPSEHRSQLLAVAHLLSTPAPQDGSQSQATFSWDQSYGPYHFPDLDGLEPPYTQDVYFQGDIDFQNIFADLPTGNDFPQGDPNLPFFEMPQIHAQYSPDSMQGPPDITGL